MPHDPIPLLQTLFSPFRRFLPKPLALVSATIGEVAQAASLAVAGHLAVQRGIPPGRAWTRVYRLLRNPRIDDQLLTAQRLWLLGQGRRLLIALDWTEGPHDLQRLLASVVVGCRAIPVQTAVFNKQAIWRSQHTWAQTFLRLLVSPLKALGQEAVLLGDRGLRRRWI